MTVAPDNRREKYLAEVKTWPTQPGIYIMRDVGERILYVGKAKNLRARIKSYFARPRTLTPKTRLMVGKIEQLEFTVTNNELEALLLECNLIKKHRPRYNIRLKDDKNFPYFVLDFTHPFPQFKVTRKVIVSPKLKYFGPYSAGVNEISRFLLKTFQIRDCTDAKFKNRKRPCLSYEIGTCTAPCVDYVTESDYSAQVREAILFLNGKKRELLASFKEGMKEASDKQEYEKARIYRDKIAALSKISARQDAVLTERMQDIDVLGAHETGEGEEKYIQWVILYIRAGFLTGRKAYRVKLGLEGKSEATGTFLQQVYSKNLVPDEVWVAEDFSDRKTLEIWLNEIAQKKVLVRVGRTEKILRLLGMAQENAKLIAKEHDNKKEANAGQALREVLDLPEPPVTVEGIDISNLQDESPVGSLVHFEDGVPIKSRYRTYHPKTVDTQNDFAMIHEVVTRRLSDKENPRPDLLMIDGGKGQLAAAAKAMEDLQISVPLCSLAKARTESAFTRKDIRKSEERIFVPGRKNPINLPESHPAMRLLVQLRDEAHRFGIKSHRNRRDKKMLEGSPLLQIEGIGKKTRDRLLKAFPDNAALEAASLEQLIVAGLNHTQAENVQLAIRERKTYKD